VLANQAEKAKPLKQDESCLACHGQPDMKSDQGKDISVNPAKHSASIHGILGCRDCHTSIKDFPHPARVRKVGCRTCHQDQSSDVSASIHSVLGETACSSCHGNVHEIGIAAEMPPSRCAECHASEQKALEASIHGQAAKAGDADAPTCKSCHGAVHAIHASDDPLSTVAKRNQATACARCHADPGFLARHRIPVLHPVEQYLQSAHRRAVMQGKDGAACADCHGSHEILPARDGHSKVSRWNVAATCATCHKEIAAVFLDSVHGQAVQAGAQDAPVCTNCHGEHLILSPANPNSPVNAARVSIETCGRCHGDVRLAQRYGLPADRVPSYAESYHGLARREGSLLAANCASCHGIHNIFRSSDPRSTVHPANLAATCGKCHDGMNATFVIGPVHVQTGQGPAHPVVQWVRWIYWLLIPMTLGFMVIHNLLDLLKKMRLPRPSHHSGRTVVRMNLWFRIAHWGVMLSFPTLVFTGFALKYPDSWWAKPILLWEGHIAFRGGLHRAAAIVLVAATLYHVVHLAVSRRDRIFLWAMLPRWRDATDLLQVLLYNLGLRQDAPTFAKFNYAEKIEYWAFLWGTAVMGVSGFILWFNNFTLRHFAKWTTDAATAVHWYEALLATFSILLWHFYLVIFDPLVYPMETAWIDGRVFADHYEHSRPEYFRALEKAGLVSGAPETSRTSESPPQEDPPERSKP
jgi:cytochrome b subunit of formate dehydrogenase/protein-arginine kinase activator protein McsA